jgi:hypothetical protein
MNTLDNLEIAGVNIPAPLSPKFDQALHGYLVRHDIPKGVACYDAMALDLLSKSIPLAEDYVFNKDTAFVVLPPPNLKLFTQLVGQGMLVWEGLNGAIVGTVSDSDYRFAQPITGMVKPVYHYELALGILTQSIVDSKHPDISTAVKAYFDEQIMLADFGPATPYVLRGNSDNPDEHNGLGGQSVLKLPSGRRGLSTYIAKHHARPQNPAVTPDPNSPQPSGERASEV